MTSEELIEMFDADDLDEFLKFERIKEPLSNRPNLHAFLLLDRLVPGTQDIIAGAAHDKIWINVDVEELAAVVTPEQVTDLIRCGVLWDSDADSIGMFA